VTEPPTVDGEPGAYGPGYIYTRRYLSGRPESSIALSTVQVTPAALQLAVVTPAVQIVAYTAAPTVC
jgi:hypothetical protein